MNMLVRNSSLIWWGWLALWAAFELPAIFWKGCPWMPLSDYIWHLEDRYRGLSYGIGAGFIVLLIHLIVRKFH